ncbi:hypothetical protein J9253_01815 [Thiothrix litoralis]|jgi:hypothetical protein|uniref:Secreted protein n=1 Tax=Thiothrix litoralis TaxID=2891210 RepID=A0ABX7WTU8_9GAMM|nr:hypothetical protein [Thiothrix litoralis]QTR46716.1 hypothetical protein J9253_01815 [Thiothrix litoralis]
MKMKSQLTLATLIVAAMFATGCQQMGGMSQQTAQQATPAPVVQEPVIAAPAAPAGQHCHNEAPSCANKCHSHAGAVPGHKHVYGCVAGQGKRPMIPRVKAKGNYKGAVSMDQSSTSVMQQYQK